MTTSFLPISGRNAITNCLVNLQFLQGADSETMDLIQKEAKLIADDNDLPAVNRLTIPQIIVGNLAPSQSQQFGVVFQRYAKDGQVACELRCEQNAVTLKISEYSRWQDLQYLLANTIYRIAPLYMSVIPAISAARIQYDDLFVSDFTSSPPAAGEIFREDSKWITLFDRDSTEQWHSHFGMFFPNDELGRDLVNVNANVNDGLDLAGSWKRSVSLTILVGRTFDVPGQTALILDKSEVPSALPKVFDTIHDRQKDILQQVLADSYLNIIGAKAS